MRKIFFILSFAVSVSYSQVADTLKVDTLSIDTPKTVGTLIDTVSDELTLCNVEAYLYHIGVKQIDIVMRQCIWETGWLKSSACINRHNLFGFANGKTGYKNWKESCDKYKIWQDAHYDINYNPDYYKWLNCMWKTRYGECVRYASAQDYTRKLKSLNYSSCLAQK